jgi:mxaJ protein
MRRCQNQRRRRQDRSPEGARVQRFAVRLAILLLASTSVSRAADERATELRVCADPDNLPFSNRDGAGLENKIAEIVARDLGMRLTYFWWPHQRGLVRRTLNEDRCDVLIGVPRDLDPVLTTKPYYRSTYVLVSRKSAHLGVRSLDDPALKQLRIGVHIDTPPWAVLGERGLMAQVKGYPLMFDYRNSDRTRRPDQLLLDVKDGALDVAIVWGPIAGYFDKHNGSTLELVPLEGSGRIPMSFDISMGVRRSDEALKARLETALDRRGAEIRSVLADYGVPLVAAAHSP